MKHRFHELWHWMTFYKWNKFKLKKVFITLLPNINKDIVLSLLQVSTNFKSLNMYTLYMYDTCRWRFWSVFHAHLYYKFQQILNLLICTRYTSMTHAVDVFGACSMHIVTLCSQDHPAARGSLGWWNILWQSACQLHVCKPPTHVQLWLDQRFRPGLAKTHVETRVRSGFKIKWIFQHRFNLNQF